MTDRSERAVLNHLIETCKDAERGFRHVADYATDPAVKSLAVFPQVLAMMSEKLDWTQKLGHAFLAQKEDVMATAQALRGKAVSQGTLKDSKEQTVVTEKANIELKQEGNGFKALPAGAKLADVVRALNTLGATPADLLAILQAMKSAGALKAELEVI